MTFDFAAARQVMVDTQVRPSDVTDVALHEAMRRVEREAFFPADKAYLAYADASVEYAPGRWLLRPREVAKLLQAIRPRAHERALAIAAPYAAKVLEALDLHVTRLEDDLKAVPAGEYDVIVCEGAVSSTPQAWLSALRPGGRLGVVVRNGPVGKARLYLRGQNDIGYRELFDSTPPVLAGFEALAGFAF